MAALVAVTDRKFAVKARLYQALGVTLAVVRSYLHSPKVLQSLVSVLKLYATDGQHAYSHVASVLLSYSITEMIVLIVLFVFIYCVFSIRLPCFNKLELM